MDNLETKRVKVMGILVSIVVPVYNVESYIDKCLDSIINQTYKNIEIIVINDGSTDRSGDICEKWEKTGYITYISKKNEGLGATRNLGIKIAKGEYLLFVDSDDWLTSDSVEKMVKHIDKDALTDVIAFSQYYEFDDQIKSLKIIRQNELIGVEPIFEETRKRKYLLYGFVVMWGKLFRREFLLCNNILMPSIPHEDNAVFPEIIFCAKLIKFFNEPLYYYRRNRRGNILSNNNHYTYMSDACENFLNYFIKYNMLDSHCPIIKHYVDTRLRWAYQSYCQNESSVELQKNIYEKFTRFYEKYFENQKPYWKYTFGLFGSFGSRWVIHMLGASSKQLRYHLPFSSVIAQMTQGEAEKYRIYNENKFRCEKIKEDMEGSFFSKLENTYEQIDFLFIDFLEERYDVAELDDGNFITLSDAFLKSSVGGVNIKRIIRVGTNDYWEIWKRCCKKLSELLKEKYKNNQIILIQSRLAAKYKSKNRFIDYPDEKIIKENNLIIEWMENYFLNLMDNKIQTYAYPEEIYTEEKFRLGVDSQYLGDLFYQKMKMQIEIYFDRNETEFMKIW